jgi:hypothetical protein
MMDKKTLIWLAAGVVVGIVLAPQISKLPLINKIPQI